MYAFKIEKKTYDLREPKARLLSAWFVTKSRASALKLKRWKKNQLNLNPADSNEKTNRELLLWHRAEWHNNAKAERQYVLVTMLLSSASVAHPRRGGTGARAPPIKIKKLPQMRYWTHFPKNINENSGWICN